MEQEKRRYPNLFFYFQELEHRDPNDEIEDTNLYPVLREMAALNEMIRQAKEWTQGVKKEIAFYSTEHKEQESNEYKYYF